MVTDGSSTWGTLSRHFFERAGDVGAILSAHAYAWLRPAYSVSYHSDDLLVVIDRIGFVAWAEVKDSPVSPLPRATATKDIASLIP